MRKNKKIWSRFLAICQKAAADEHQLETFFEVFLTIEEKEQLITRTLIVQKLLEGKSTQRDIAKELGISIAKITRGSNALKLISEKQIDQMKKMLDVVQQSHSR